MAQFHADTLVKDVLSAHPEAASVLERHGLGCASCLAAAMDTLASAASVHEVSLDTLLAELNQIGAENPGRES